MKVLLRLIWESASQALQQLWANKLRSFLSLLGVTIGIFCIVGVRSAVSSLESQVRSSFDKLGNDVIYIQKIEWGNVGEEWFKYLRRPPITYKDYTILKERLKSAQVVSMDYDLGSKTLKFRSSSKEDVPTIAVTYEFAELYAMEIENGRYLSPSEYFYGANKILLGHKVAEELFNGTDPVGKIIKWSGRKMEVIGVIKKSANDLGIASFDDAALIPFSNARKSISLSQNSFWGNMNISVKPRAGITTQEIKDDIISTMRAHRRLKPKEENNFGLNSLSIITKALDGFFGTLNILGGVIGGFSIFVGMFSVANIMFVSVKERTSLIGIKKALGAKRFFILLEFLTEAVVLCILGGIIGLVLVYFGIWAIAKAIDFNMYMSFNNFLFGLLISIVVGVLAGLIPAWQAARMDPVVAMRK